MCPGDQNIIGYVLMMQKQLDTRPEENKICFCDKTAKLEVQITDNQLWNSCCRAVSDHESSFGSAIKPTKHSAL